MSFNPRKLAPAKAGIDSKNDILPESTLLKFKNLAAVIVIPALLTPGINASICNNPINIIDLTFKSLGIVFKPPRKFWSKSHCMLPTIQKLKKGRVRIFFGSRNKNNISSVECNMYPKIISGIEPIMISFNNVRLFFKFNKSFLK